MSFLQLGIDGESTDNMAPQADDAADEAALIERAKTVSEAFGRLFELHYQRILDYIYRSTLNLAENYRRQRQYATKARRAHFHWNILEQAQQLGIVVRIRGIAGRAGIQRGEPRGADSGLPVERVHFQTGIVGQNEIR